MSLDAFDHGAWDAAGSAHESEDSDMDNTELSEQLSEQQSLTVD